MAAAGVSRGKLRSRNGGVAYGSANEKRRHIIGGSVAAAKSENMASAIAHSGGKYRKMAA
jgi:hypothetical protein